MKYKTGFFSSIFNNVWAMSTEENYFSCERRGEKHRIDYYGIRGLRVEDGIVWDTLVLSTHKENLHLEGLSAETSELLTHDLEKRTKKVVANHILEKKHLLGDVARSTDEFLNSNRYIAQTDIRQWLSSMPQIGEDLSHPFCDPNLLPKAVQAKVKKFISIKEPGSELLKEVNAKFVEKSMCEYADLFSCLESYPLTDEQMRAAIIDEDRNLLIAAAGSGKSSTIVAKAAYLVKAGLAKPDEILVLAYNKDAQLEIEQRLTDLTEIVPEISAPIKAKTFHSLGIEIIVKIEEIKPSISELATAGKTRLSNLFSGLIKSLCQKDPDFMKNWVEFQLIAKKPTPELFQIKTYAEYNNYLWELGALRRNSPQGSRLLLPTLDGNEVKSMEEVRIANWLFLNGIEYQYEKSYSYNTATETHRQYYPDFYYPDADLYHEHFALDAEGKTPSFMSADYIEGVDWKRKAHEENGTKLVETHSAHFHDGSIFENLQKLLTKNGVKLHPLEFSEIDALVEKVFNPEVDTQIFTTFLHHFKANNATIALVGEKAKSLPDQVRIKIFLKTFEAIFGEYSSQLQNNNEIDFEDQINKACTYIESNKYQHSFKYILVDEFQDTSQDRKRIIHALLDQREETKLFAVGDDWQSIYRFAGADIDIMTHFSHHFGATSENYLTQTFRSYRGIVDVAATFIQRNDNQIKKSVSAFNDVEKSQVIISEYGSDRDQGIMLEQLLEKLASLKSDKQLRVFLLARYNHQKPQKLSRYLESYSNLNIKFSTIHASKGLEADYVILLSVGMGSYAFPSTITDDPLLHLVIPRPESYPYAEERRLLYVAITRAKRAVFIFSSQTKTSPFVKELVEIDRVNSPTTLMRENPCPKPNCVGDLKRKAGKYGAFLGCSNYPDCDYTENLR